MNREEGEVEYARKRARSGDFEPHPQFHLPAERRRPQQFAYPSPSTFSSKPPPPPGPPRQFQFQPSTPPIYALRPSVSLCVRSLAVNNTTRRSPPGRVPPIRVAKSTVAAPVVDSPPTSLPGNPPGPCYLFRVNKSCKWGDRCRFAHIPAPLFATVVPPPRLSVAAAPSSPAYDPPAAACYAPLAAPAHAPPIAPTYPPPVATPAHVRSAPPPPPPGPPPAHILRMHQPPTPQPVEVVAPTYPKFASELKTKLKALLHQVAPGQPSFSRAVEDNTPSSELRLLEEIRTELEEGKLVQFREDCLVLAKMDMNRAWLHHELRVLDDRLAEIQANRNVLF